MTNLGSEERRLRFVGERLNLRPRTDDPTNLRAGTAWIRGDLDDDQLATFRYYDGNETVDLPIVTAEEDVDEEGGISKALRVVVAGEDGFIPIAPREDATHPEWTIQHAGDMFGFTDNFDGIPNDSLYWNGEGDLEDGWEIKLADENTTFEKQSDRLFIENEGDEEDFSYITVGTTSRQDITGKSGVRVLSDGEMDGNNNYRIAVTESNPDDITSEWDESKQAESGDSWTDVEHILDVSELSGEYYVGIGSEDRSTLQSRSVKLEIYEIELVD